MLGQQIRDIPCVFAAYKLNDEIFHCVCLGSHFKTDLNHKEKARSGAVDIFQ